MLSWKVSCLLSMRVILSPKAIISITCHIWLSLACKLHKLLRCYSFEEKWSLMVLCLNSTPTWQVYSSPLLPVTVRVEFRENTNSHHALCLSCRPGSVEGAWVTNFQKVALYKASSFCGGQLCTTGHEPFILRVRSQSAWNSFKETAVLHTPACHACSTYAGRLGETQSLLNLNKLLYNSQD